MRVTTAGVLIIAGVCFTVVSIVGIVIAHRRGNEHAIVYLPMGMLGVYLFGWSVLEKHKQWLSATGVVLILGAYAYQYFLWQAQRERNQAKPGQGTSDDRQGKSVGR